MFIRKNCDVLYPCQTGGLLPSHGLPPFGANITNIAMSESLCGTSMFGGDRWGVGVNPMTAGKYKSVHRGTDGQNSELFSVVNSKGIYDCGVFGLEFV